MSELAPLIADLALILICAGVMALVFKKLKQPLVLGYIVAGFIASPHFSLTPSVIDTASIQVWSDIGVIFLLFALGLEFSFKKIVKVGGPAIIAALTIIFGMIFLGITVGSSFGWKRMDAIFLGGMIAMSSTAIIYKAFDDLGLRKKQFTGLVLSILILEDILAVLLMVILSTIAVSNSFEGGELLMSIGKLLFFIILWFVVGLYLIPQLLRRTRTLMNDETLLVVALGLCFGMVVVAAKLGFSAAFGAFIMGSILAETVEAEHIDRIVTPVKDLFGAIFFVSVGMMVDPAMIVKYAGPILAITLTVLVGQATFATIGVLLSGQNLKTAMQSGFSLTQIGEFAFIEIGLIDDHIPVEPASCGDVDHDDCIFCCAFDRLPGQGRREVAFLKADFSLPFAVCNARCGELENRELVHIDFGTGYHITCSFVVFALLDSLNFLAETEVNQTRISFKIKVEIA